MKKIWQTNLTYKNRGKTIFNSKMFQGGFWFIPDLFGIDDETINIDTLYKMGLGAREHLIYQG